MRNTFLPARPQSLQAQPQLSRRKLYAAMLIASQCMVAGQLWAAPEGGVVVGGEGAITQTGMDTMIHQATERMAIDWRSFDVAANERVEFIQPSSSSVALNRVLSNRGSEILGRIDANGQVMLVNPNGVVFGKNSIVNVGGMIASGLSIDPTSFINGDFALNSIDGAEGKVINYGIINAAIGGSVTLVGEQVQNDGLISAKLGAVNLVAGNAAVLTFDSSGMLGVRVTESVVQDELGVDTAVINNGSINAEGGRVLLSASVSEDIFSNAVNNAGMNKESSVVMHDDGSFTLGAGADVVNTGDISVSTTNGNAGQIVALGRNITHSGSISANTSKGSGGSVELHSTDTTLLTENSTVSAQANSQGEGGDVKVLGNKVGLFDEAEVNASGANGGGQVLVGGDKTGDNQKIRNADFIYLGENTNVKTDALVDGDGGKLITFASDTARIYGSLYSRGGSFGGDGGFIETSGLNGFEILKSPDVGAGKGKGGLWLIDPYNISITNSGRNELDLKVEDRIRSFTAVDDDNVNTLLVNTLLGALNNGHVTVQTGADGKESGKITVASAINYAGQSDKTLTFLAGNGIDINSSITSSSAQLNLVLNANSDNTGGGDFKIANGVSLSTNGGEVTITSVNFDSSTNGIGTIDTSSKLGGGDITIKVGGYADVGQLIFKDTDGNDNLRTQVGNVLIQADGDVNLNHVIEFDDTGFINLNNADVTSSFTIESNRNININALIHDNDDGNIDALNIKLIADKGGVGNEGKVNFNQDIYTAGGNFEASGFDLVFNGKKIDTENANGSSFPTSDRSNGGTVTLISSSNLELGSIVTDATCATTNNCTGNLVIQRRNSADTISISQATGKTLSIAGDSTFNVGSSGGIDLSEANGFTKNVFITSAGDVTINNTKATVLGNSTISGDFTLTSKAITQFAGSAITVTGDSNLEASNENITLANENNNFDGIVTFNNAANVSLRDVGNLIVGESLVAGDVNLTSNSIVLSGNINTTAGTTDDKDITFNGNVILANAVTLTAAGGDITFESAANSADATARDLTLVSNNLFVKGAVGVNQTLGAIGITADGKVELKNSSNFAQDIVANSLQVTKASSFLAGNITTMTGNVKITAANLIDVDSIDVSAVTEGTIDLTVNGIGATKTINIDGDLKANDKASGEAAINLTLANTSAAGEINLDRNSFLSSNITATGSGSADTIKLTNSNNTWTTSSANTGTVKDSSNLLASPVITFSGFETLTGGTQVDDFTLAHTISTAINGGNGNDKFAINVVSLGAIINGGAGADEFNINTTITELTLNGDAGADIFNVTTTDAVTATLKGGDGGDTLNAANRTNTWVLGGSEEKLNGTLGFSSVENINGNSGKDSFSVGDRTVSGTVNAAGGDVDEVTVNGDANISYVDTGFSLFGVANAEILRSTGGGKLKVSSDNTDNIVWEFLNTGESVTDGSNLVKISGFTSYEGGNGNDTFSIKSALSSIGILDGAGGENIFDGSFLPALTANSIAVGSEYQNGSLATLTNIKTIKGNDVSSLQLISGTNIWEITARHAGSVGAIDFTGIATIVGAQNDSINTSISDDANWSITGTNKGALSAKTTPQVELIAFSDIGNLVGSDYKDTFSFLADSSVVSAQGNGGTDTADLSNLAAQTITVGVSTGFSFSGVEQLQADWDKAFVLTTQGGAVWDIDGSSGANSGTVAGTKFIGFKTLRGSDGDDTFNLSAGFSGEINAGAGSDSFVFYGTGSVVTASGGSGVGIDTVNLSNLSGATDITLSGNTIKDVLDIERVVVNAANNSTLTANGNSIWDIYDVDVNAATTHDGKVAGMEFIGFKNLAGGTGVNAGVDTFNINNSFDGTISGGDGADTFNISASVTNLQGGAGRDSFVFYSAGSVGAASGGSDADTDTVDISYLNGAQNITLDGNSIKGVSDIERVVAKADNNNTLTAYGNNTWDIYDVDGNAATTHDGKVAGIEFIGFKTLAGGTGANAGVDTFNINNNFDGTISGDDGADTFNINANVTTINGGAGADIFNIQAMVNGLQGGAGNDSFVFYDTGSVIGANGGADFDTVNLLSLSGNLNILLSSGTINGVSNSERVVANADNSNMLTANGNNTWDIKELDGDLSTTHDVKVAGIEFIGFKNLAGGTGANAGVDTFNINNNFDGTISGGDGADTFNIYAQIGNASGGNGADTFAFFDGGSIATGGVIDAGTDSAIDSVDLRNLLSGFTVNISGSTVHGIANIERVKADSNKSFTLAASNIPNTWTVEAANGIDGKLNQLEFVGFKTLQGGAGVDAFDIKTNFAGAINGNGGADSFAINAAFSGALDGGADADTFTINAAFTGNLSGGAGNDNFIFTNTGSVAPAQNNTADGGDGIDIVDLSGVDDNNVIALNGSVIYGLGGIERVIGNSNRNFTLDASATTTALSWLIDVDGTGSVEGVNDGRVQGIEFIDFKILRGSSGADSFTFNKDFTGTVEGLSGDDTFTINTSITGDLLGGDGADRFVFSTTGSIANNGSANAGNGADIVDLSTIANVTPVELTGSNTLYGVSNVERIIGNNLSTLSTNQSGITWEIYDFDGDDDGGTLSDGVNDGKVAGIEFIDFINLQGSGGADTFDLRANFAGVIRGGGGSDTFIIRAAGITGTLLGEGDGDSYVFHNGGSISSTGNSSGGDGIDIADFSNLDDGATVFISSNLIENVAGIERVAGSSSKQFTLAAAGNTANIWRITNTAGGNNFGDGVNDGIVNNIQFTDFKKLLGGSGVDQFVFESANASVESIDGGGGVNTLQGRNAANTWKITADNAGTVSANGNVYTTFNRIQNLTGGSLADIFDINAVITNVDGADGDDRFVFDSLNNAGQATSIIGGGGQNELVGRDSDNTWSTTASNAGSVAGYVTAFDGIQRLVGGDGADVFNLNHAITNGVQAGDGNNIFHVNTGVSHLIGGAGDDQFVFGDQGSAQSVDGGGGTANSLTGRNGANIWTIEAGTNSKIASGANTYLDSFSNIQILNGGTGNDTFNINATVGSIYGHAGIDTFNINAASGRLYGGADNDTFSFTANNSGTATLIDGGAEAIDTIRGRSQNSTWTMTGANSGSVATDGTTYVTEFVRIETLAGEANEDTLAAVNQANRWSVTGDDTGSLRADISGNVPAINFGGMEHLRGSEAKDTFVFGEFGNITGLVDGGTSLSLDTVDDLDLTAIKNDIHVQLGYADSDALNVVNIENISAAAVEGKVRALTGSSDAALGYLWQVTDNDVGMVQNADLTSSNRETSVNFNQFNRVTGGTRNDTFQVVKGDITGQIHGGDGNGRDYVDYSERAESFSIIVGGNDTFSGAITGIEGIKGNSGKIGGFTSTIQIASGNDDVAWTIGAQNASATLDGVNDGSVRVGQGSVVDFENFTHLVGGSGNDTFTYLQNGLWSGSLSGGVGGYDVIMATASTQNQTFILNGAQVGSGTNINNFDDVQGNASTASTLVSTLAANAWTIDAGGDGDLNGMDFKNIANLQGGSFKDIFTISNLSWLTGTIDGGGGAETDLVDMRGIASAVSVAVDADTLADINALNMEQIVANTGLANRLIGGATLNKWTINALNAGTLNDTLSFVGFGYLTGRDLTDTVVFANNSASVSGELDMGAGTDVLDLSASNRNLTVHLHPSDVAGNGNDVIAVRNIERITGATGSTRANTLVGGDYNNIWTINGADAGRISSAEAGVVEFTNFRHLTGGNLDDIFNFEASGNLTGLLNGGDHSARDVVDLSKSNVADVVIAALNSVTGFTNIERYIGNNIDSSLTAADVENKWSLSGNNRGTLNGIIEFENFGILKGGNQKDEFIISQANISGSIDSGDGDDTFDIRESAIAGKIQAGNGADLFDFFVTPGFSGTANIDGGAGNNRLTVSGGDATYKASHQFGSTEYVDGNNNTYSVLYSNLNNIVDEVVASSLSIFGTATDNSFRLQTGRYSVDSNSLINYSNKANLVVNGLAGDKVVIDGVVNIAGGVTFSNLSVLSENGGVLQAQSLELVSTGDVGSSGSRLKTVVSDLSLNATNGNVYLEEQDALNLKSFNVSTTDTVDLIVGGTLSSTNPLIYTGALNIESLRGNINLGNNNVLSGLLNLKTTQDITLGNAPALLIENLSSQNANLSSGTSITSTGIFSVSGLTTLNAMTDLTFVNSGNDFNQLSITNAGNASIYDKNGFTTAGVSVSNNAELGSAGNIIVGAACGVDCANNYGIKAKSLKIESGAAVSVNKSIVAGEAADIQAQGITINDALASKKIVLNGGNGKLLLNEAGSLLAQGGGSIDIAANSIEQHSVVASDGNIKAVAVGDIVMMSRATIESQLGEVDLSSHNMKLALVKATKGAVIMNAKGAITDGNLGETNIIASAWRADAVNGIGAEGIDAIETDVSRLSVRNSGRATGAASSINIANMNTVVIEQLINNGNILFSNANGDVVLDNTNNLEFDITKTNAIEQGGVINANTGVNGGVLTLSINGGSVRAINKVNKANPDVIAESASFIYPQQNVYAFGERNRKIVMHIPTRYYQSARTSAVLWHVKKPTDIIDTSIPLKNLLTNDQLIQLEGLSEIDPAIFTNVRNYVHDEVAILMPVDQRFDEDEYAE